MPNQRPLASRAHNARTASVKKRGDGSRVDPVSVRRALTIRRWFHGRAHGNSEHWLSFAGSRFSPVVDDSSTRSNSHGSWPIQAADRLQIGCTLRPRVQKRSRPRQVGPFAALPATDCHILSGSPCLYAISMSRNLDRCAVGSGGWRFWLIARQRFCWATGDFSRVGRGPRRTQVPMAWVALSVALCTVAVARVAFCLKGIRDRGGSSDGDREPLNHLPHRLRRIRQAPTSFIARTLRSVQVTAYKSECDSYEQPTRLACSGRSLCGRVGRACSRNHRYVHGRGPAANEHRRGRDMSSLRDPRLLGLLPVGVPDTLDHHAGGVDCRISRGHIRGTGQHHAEHDIRLAAHHLHVDQFLARALITMTGRLQRRVR